MPHPAPAQSVPERVATVLGAHVTDLFGLMGNGNAHLIDAFGHLTAVRFHGVRHEVATVASADAYHRVSRRLAAATTTYGPGFTNTLTALADAAQAHVPLVLVTGAAPTSGLRPWDVDQAAAAQAVSVPTFTVTTADAGAVTASAVRHALRERSPVVLAIPFDLITADAAPENDPGECEPATVPVDMDALATAAEALLGSDRPLILAGRGARAAAAALRGVADALGALTVATAPMRGVFAGRALDLGVCGGFASDRTRQLVRSADVVLVVGAGLNQFTTEFGQAFGSARILRVDDVDDPGGTVAYEPVRGDALRASEALLVAVSDAASRRRWVGVDPATVMGATFDRPPGLYRTATGRLDPRTLARELDGIIPEERIVVFDGGHFFGWANMYWRVPSADSLVMVGAHSQAVGLGFASTPGVAVAAPDRPLVVVTGDGGGLMGLADLDSVVRTASSAIVVVFNDGAYTAEMAQYGEFGIGTGPMMIDPVDFSLLARGVGAEGIVVRTLGDLTALRAWVDRGADGTILLDCRVDGTVIAPYLTEMVNARERGRLGQR